MATYTPGALGCHSNSNLAHIPTGLQDRGVAYTSAPADIAPILQWRGGRAMRRLALALRRAVGQAVPKRPALRTRTKPASERHHGGQ